MALNEEKGFLSYKNKDGVVKRLLPKTFWDCILGKENVDGHLADKTNPHNTTAKQVGAVATEDIAAINEVREFIGF